MSLLFVVDDRYVHLFESPETELGEWVPEPRACTARVRPGSGSLRVSAVPMVPHGAGASTPAVVVSGDGRASTLPGAGVYPPAPAPGNPQGRS